MPVVALLLYNTQIPDLFFASHISYRRGSTWKARNPNHYASPSHDIPNALKLPITCIPRFWLVMTRPVERKRAEEWEGGA
mmetsp:Transcript_13283/g.21037  ORF Transcript_13283/g.21037 Transcript_13283/m.21037 type:complete len:80 (+) Transcript_13283:207-446(+)